jgi:predicted phage terminase large subunit-like protein
LFDIKTGEDNKTWYKNSKKGERFATSTGGSVTGIHADFIIVDDPLNVKKAESEVEREQANKHVFETLSSRKTDRKRSVTIIIMQRLHEKDVAGTLLKKKKVNHICLPGERSNITSPEARDFYVDNLLDPIRLDRVALSTLKVNLGTYGYAGQIGQDPTPEGGGILKKEWFKKISKEEFFLKYFKNGKKTIVLDTAYTEDQKNDHTASLSCCFYENIHYIYNAREMWLEFPDLIKKIKEIAFEDNIDNGKILVEPKASGKSIVQTLKNSTLNVIELPPPKDDKYTRVYDISADVEAGKVVLVEGDWNDSFIHQCITFPNAEHDDMIDCLVYQINYCKLAPKAPKLTMSGYVR